MGDYSSAPPAGSSILSSIGSALMAPVNLVRKGVEGVGSAVGLVSPPPPAYPGYSATGGRRRRHKGGKRGKRATLKLKKRGGRKARTVRRH